MRGQTHPSRQTWVALVPMYYPLKGYAPRRFGASARAPRVYPADLAEEMDLTLHPQEAADKARAGMPDSFTGTPGDFPAGGNMPPVTANGLEEAWAALKY